jgi:hypothetical protein
MVEVEGPAHGTLDAVATSPPAAPTTAAGEAESAEAASKNADGRVGTAYAFHAPPREPAY